MATLRQAIQSRIDALQNQVTQTKADAAAAIAPLQVKISNQQERLLNLAPWLDMEISVAQTKLNQMLDAYRA